MESDQARLPERIRHLYEQTLFAQSLPTPLLFRAESVGDLLGDERGVAALGLFDLSLYKGHFLLTDTFLFRKVDPFGGAQQRLLKG
jgi:hypothetical protein